MRLLLWSVPPMPDEKKPPSFDWSEPVMTTTCLACGAVFEEPIGIMIRACRDCTPIALPSFEQGWTRDNFTALCQQILASRNVKPPGSPIFKAVQKKRCAALCRALKK